MLESNTDRSYFMIGAVVLAGIIIAAAVYIFDTKIFGSEGILTETFDSLTETANKAIGVIAEPKTPGAKTIETPGAKTIMGLGSQLKIGFDMLFL